MSKYFRHRYLIRRIEYAHTCRPRAAIRLARSSSELIYPLAHARRFRIGGGPATRGREPRARVNLAQTCPTRLAVVARRRAGWCTAGELRLIKPPFLQQIPLWGSRPRPQAKTSTPPLHATPCIHVPGAKGVTSAPPVFCRFSGWQLTWCFQPRH